MRGRPPTFLPSLLEREEVDTAWAFSAFRGLNLATDNLLEAKLSVLMVLVVGLKVVWAGAGFALTLTFCLLLGGDVSSIWLGPILSVGCIFPISCKSPLSFTHFVTSFPSLQSLNSPQFQ